MQVNHEEVDTVLNDRQQRINGSIMRMRQEIETQRKGWTEVRVVPKAALLAHASSQTIFREGGLIVA